MAMKQLTLRGFDDELEAKLRELASKEHISLNKAALKLLREAAGLDPEKPGHNKIGSALDDFIGSWSEAEEHDFNKLMHIFEEIDSDLWT